MCTNTNKEGKKCARVSLRAHFGNKHLVMTVKVGEALGNERQDNYKNTNIHACACLVALELRFILCTHTHTLDFLSD